jgi:hypothetical protein
MTDSLNHVDLCFVVDTTGSMGPFIEEAKRRLADLLGTLTSEQGLDLQVGLVEYRDHPPQDHSFVTRAQPLSTDWKQIRRGIDRLQANGGGDMNEAVYDGVAAACREMQWRPHGHRFVLLVGDAPPHGPLEPAPVADTGDTPRRTRRHGGGSDAWPEGCPCGLTLHTVTAAAEQARVIVHALCMIAHEPTQRAFTAIAGATGGRCVPATQSGQVIARLLDLLREEVRHLPFDRQVLTSLQSVRAVDSAALAAEIGCARVQVAASLARLGRRGLLAGYSSL